MSIRQVAEVVRGLVDPHLPVEFVPARPGDYGGRPVSAEKAGRVLGWRPRTSFEEGMRHYVDWYLAEAEADDERASEG